MNIQLAVTILFIIFAYLAGSVNCAILICKSLKLPDPRSTGSNNPGATNVSRIGGRKVAAGVLAGDVLKGFIPVIIARLIGIEHAALGYVALTAVVGHMFPVFFNFKGGKGVATLFGILLGMSFSLTVGVIVVWVIVAGLFRYVSAASITAAISAPLLTTSLSDPKYFIPLFFMMALIIFKHRSNISRLINGTESRIGKKNKKSDTQTPDVK